MKDFSRIVQELAPRYLAARKQELAEMTDLLAASDFERLRVLSHSLKGSGSSFGFPELTRFGLALEQHAARLDSVSFGKDLARLTQYLEQIEVPPDTNTKV